jgi:hypothetical protein
MRRHAVIGNNAPNWTRRACLGALVMLGLPTVTQARPATLASAKSLRDELALALKSGNPLVVMVSLDGCPFCKAVREQYLAPLREQEGLPVVQVVQVDMHSAAALQDFNGLALTHDHMVRTWGIKIAPSLLFFGADGVEVAPRLVGVGSMDYYGSHLDQRLSQARAAIKAA